MIFIGGIGQGQRELDYRRAALLCAICGGYGRYQVFMTYTYFSFFFIHIDKKFIIAIRTYNFKIKSFIRINILFDII